MEDKEISELMDLLYPFLLKKLRSEGMFKKCIKSSNATVVWVDTTTNNNERVSNIGKSVKVKFPYDTAEFTVINKSFEELNIGDIVCLHYNIDLKNAYIAYKV